MAVSISLFVLGLVLLAIAPRMFPPILDVARTRVGPVIGWGLIIAIGLPIVSVIVMVTLVGIPLGLIGLLSLALLCSVGYVIAALLLGRRLLAEPRNMILAFLRSADPARHRLDPRAGRTHDGRGHDLRRGRARDRRLAGGSDAGAPDTASSRGRGHAAPANWARVPTWHEAPAGVSTRDLSACDSAPDTPRSRMTHCSRIATHRAIFQIATSVNVGEERRRRRLPEVDAGHCLPGDVGGSCGVVDREGP